MFCLHHVSPPAIVISDSPNSSIGCLSRFVFALSTRREIYGVTASVVISEIFACMTDSSSESGIVMVAYAVYIQYHLPHPEFKENSKRIEKRIHENPPKKLLKIERYMAPGVGHRYLLR